MKNYVLTFAFMAVYLISGCTSDVNDPQNHLDKDFVNLVERYQKQRIETDQRLFDMFQDIQNKSTRSLTSNETQSLFQYIVTANPDEVYNIYNSNIELCEQENVYYDDAVVYSAVVSATSEVEANNLYKFIELYIDRRGHDMNILSKAINGMSIPVQNAMIQSACVIDNIF